MAATKRFFDSDPLYDAKRSMITYDEYNKLWDGRNRQSDYQRVLRLLLRTAEMNDPRERENEESSLDKTCKLVRGRKISTGVFEPIQQMNQHRLGMQPRTNVNWVGKGPQKDFLVREKDSSVGVRGKKKLDSRARNVEDELLSKKIASNGSSLKNRKDLRLGSVSKWDGRDTNTNPQHGNYVNYFTMTDSDSENSSGDSDGSDQSKCMKVEYNSENDKDDSDVEFSGEETWSSDIDIRKDRPGCSKLSGNLLKSRKVRPLIPRPSPMEFEYVEEEFKRAVSHKKNMLRDQTRNLEKRVKGKEVFVGDDEFNKKTAAPKNKGNLYTRHDPIFNLIPRAQTKNVGILPKDVKGKSVVIEYTSSNTKANKWSNEQETVQSQKMLKKMVDEPKSRHVVRLGNERAHQKRVDHDRPEKVPAESRNELKKVAKENNLIQKSKKKIRESDSDDSSDDMDILYSSDDTCECEQRRKPRSGFEPIEKLGLLNHQRQTNENSVQTRLGKRKSVQADHEASKEAMTRKNKQYFCNRKFLARENADDDSERADEVFYQIFGPRNDRLKRKPIERADEGRPGKKYYFHGYQDLKKSAKGKTVVKGDGDASKRSAIGQHGENFHLRRSPRINLVIEDQSMKADIQPGPQDELQNRFEHVDQSDKEMEVESRSKSKKMVQGENVSQKGYKPNANSMNNNQEKDKYDNFTHYRKMSPSAAVPAQHLPCKGFSVPVLVPAQRSSPTPLILPCPEGDGGVQGLGWNTRRLRVDEDGDIADEFLVEVLRDASIGMQDNNNICLPTFEVNNSTRPAEVRDQILKPN